MFGMSWVIIIHVCIHCIFVDVKWSVFIGRKHYAVFFFVLRGFSRISVVSRRAPHDIFFKKCLFALWDVYIVRKSSKLTRLNILLFEKSVLFLPASWAVPKLLPAGRRKGKPLTIITSACYTYEFSFCGNIIICLL